MKVSNNILPIKISNIFFILIILMFVGITIYNERIGLAIGIITILYILTYIDFNWSVVFLSSGLFILFFIFEKIELESGKLLTSHSTVLFGLYLLNEDQRIKWKELFNLPIILTGILGLILVLNLSQSTAFDYGFIKSVRFFLYNLFFIVIGYLFVAKTENIYKYIFFTSIISIFLSIISIFYYFWYGIPEAYGGRVVLVPGMNYIWFSRTLGVMLISNIVLLINNKAKGLYSLIILFTIPGIITGFILSGSRGPFFAAIFSVIVLLFLIIDLKYWKKFILTFGILLLLLLALYLSGKGTRLLQNPFELTKDFSALHRVEAWLRSVQLYFSNPILGIGTGSFKTIGSNLFPWLPAFLYPHNLILEVACEYGSLGLLVLLLFLGLIIIRSLKMISISENNEKLLLCYLFSLFVFTVLNSMVSGDITMNAEIWIYAGYLTGYYYRYDFL